MKSLLLAISFLTTMPVNLKEAPGPGDLGRSGAWFPWLGLVIGALAALAFYGLSLAFQPLLAAALAAALWVALTGGLHLDGLADCCDGLFHPSNPQRRLEIMKDPRLGSFGGLGLVLAVVLKIIAIANLSEPALLLGLPLAAAAGRWLLLPAGMQPQARPGGMGADFAAGLSPRVLLLGALPVLVLAGLAGWRGLAGLTAACIAALAIFRLARSRLGGLTGDVFGLTVEAAEIAVLLAFNLR